MNKTIDRGETASDKIFNERTLLTDFPTVLSLITPGLRVLDVGCGTGALTRDVARLVGSTGNVTGIDNTEKFIVSGKESYGDIGNLTLIHADLFSFTPESEFDLIISARTLQWMNNPSAAIGRMKQLLKPGAYVSVLDYNHEAIEWTPDPPQTMQRFYAAFLKWRADAGMNNHISEDLVTMFVENGFHHIEQFASNEIYQRGENNFSQRAGIWSKVASLKQIVEEGYFTEEERLLTINEYDAWVQNDAKKMILKLKEVRARK